MARSNYCRTRRDELEDLAGLLKEASYRAHGSVSAAGKKTMMSAATLHNKMKQPGALTLDDLADIRKVCAVDKERLMELLRRVI